MRFVRVFSARAISCALSFFRYGSGEVIIMQGEIGLRFFVLLEGEADVYISGSEGDDRMPVCAFSLLVWASRCTRPPLPAACTA
jgi:hypothetical protein